MKHVGILSARNLLIFAVPAAIGILLMALRHPVIGLIFVLPAAVFLVHLIVWTLSFDPETGEMEYRTLFGGLRKFTRSEIRNARTVDGNALTGKQFQIYVHNREVSERICIPAEKAAPLTAFLAGQDAAQ